MRHIKFSDIQDEGDFLVVWYVLAQNLKQFNYFKLHTNDFSEM